MNDLHIDNLIVYHATLFNKDGAYDLTKIRRWGDLKTGDIVRSPLYKERFFVTRVSKGCVDNLTADLTLIEE